MRTTMEGCKVAERVGFESTVRLSKVSNLLNYKLGQSPAIPSVPHSWP